MRFKTGNPQLPGWSITIRMIAFVVTIILFFSGCEEKRNYRNELDGMNWIVGSWISEDLQYAEKWKYEDKHYIGKGYKIVGYDTIPQEEMMIILDHEKILFLTRNAKVEKEKFLAFDYKPEYSDLLIFENDQIDYPRRIIYRRMPYDVMKIRFEGPDGANPKAFTMKKKS